MKISCLKDHLQYAVQTVQKAIATKTPMPILTGVYIETQEDKIELQATDYEVGISCTIPAVIEEPGSVVLPGRYFQELVRKLPGEKVLISNNYEERTINISSNNSQFNLLSLPPEEFPVLKPISSENIINIKDSLLRDLIKKTSFACANDESRPMFSGCLLEIEGQEVRMVATNTHRLALKKGRINGDAIDTQMIIPAKILHEIPRILVPEVPQNVKLSWQKNQVGIACENVYINSRLIEGQFPDYNKVIPEAYATTIILKTEQFLDAVERVSLLAREGEYNVVRFNFQKDNVIITSNNPDIGKAYESLPLIEMNGSEIEIAFNAKYISDILKNIDTKELMFSLNSSLSPANIKPADDEDYTYIITPVRTS